jgi:hypothetical protein
MKKVLGIFVLGLFITFIKRKSYKDIEDEKFHEVIDYIEFLKKNPS